MTEVKTELEYALWRVCYSANRQLEGMGKGRDPSPRLQDGFDLATKLLGFDPTKTAPEFNDD